MLTHTSNRQSEQGFTLVELAIVMVIIGLLIGGILKGQELIANAKISSTVGQLKGLDAAINTFFDKYNARPGDMRDATTRLQGCTGNCGNGNGDTQIGTNLSFPAAGTEPIYAFIHLSLADLVSGVDWSGSAADVRSFGKGLPNVKAGGGMWIGYANGAVANTTLQVNKQYAVLNGAAGDVTNTTGAFTANTAAQIDRKMDDGQPQTGVVQTVGSNCTAGGNGSAASYQENAATSQCAMYSRVLN